LTRAFDTVLELLMRPRVRRVRRWSFVVTLPFAAFVAWRFGVHDATGVIALRLAVTAVVAAVAWRLPGERGEAVRDLLMHPRLRAYTRAELDVLLTVPRLLARRTSPAAGMTYHRGGDDGYLALACVPPLLAESVVVHLLLPHGWLVAQVVNGAVHLYAAAWLVGIGLGRRAWPHAVRGGALVVRNGALYRAQIPLGAIVSAEPARERIAEGGFHVRDDEALFPARRRVDVRIELAEPVRVARPLSDPVWATSIAVASDDPTAFIAALSGARVPVLRPHRSFLLAPGLIGADVFHTAR
jgi:hypothetical protein